MQSQCSTPAFPPLLLSSTYVGWPAARFTDGTEQLSPFRPFTPISPAAPPTCRLIALELARVRPNHKLHMPTHLAHSRPFITNLLIKS